MKYTLPKEWERVKLGDIISTESQTINLKEISFINYLETANLTDNTISSVKYLKVKRDKIPSRAKQIVEKDMILYSCVRPNLKHYGIIKQPLENMVCSTGFATLTIENKEYANADFLYYNLTQEHYINLLHTIASTSTSSYPSITPDDLLDLDLALPPLPIQNNIARILSVLDSKIELNNRISKELENLAKLLYTRYFVEFNFPNEQGKPYKSSGGAMVYSETLKREIPKDWEVLKLSHRLHFERGAEFGTSSYAQSQLTPNHIKFYRVGDMLDSQNSVYIDSNKEDAAHQ